MTEWREVESPKIWVSRFMSDIETVGFDWVTQGEKIYYIKAVRNEWKLADEQDAPKSLHFARNKEIPRNRRDAFLMVDALLVVSKALRDVLVEFDLGRTQLFEVPIHADKNGTPSDLPNHYMLNMHAPKDTMIPELSKWVGLPQPSWPGAKYRPESAGEIVAVTATSSEGSDLWHDPNLRNRFFMSDRLKQAIDAANLKVAALDLYPARVFERAVEAD